MVDSSRNILLNFFLLIYYFKSLAFRTYLYFQHFGLLFRQFFLVRLTFI